eukprot:scaffold189886_cov15-Tisochrysis_lutea.AAC.1
MSDVFAAWRANGSVPSFPRTSAQVTLHTILLGVPQWAGSSAPLKILNPFKGLNLTLMGPPRLGDQVCFQSFKLKLHAHSRVTR